MLIVQTLENLTKLKLEKKQLSFKSGAFGTVFFHPDGLATKVFKKQSQASREYICKVFKSEVDAYGAAIADSELRKIVPAFYGIVFVEKIVNECNIDISGEFELDLSYQMQKIEGCFQKIHNVPKDQFNFLKGLFLNAGIEYIEDASVVLDLSGNVRYIVDFALKEYEFECQI